MFKENNAEILEKVCELFSKMKVESNDTKMKLTDCMQCVIHKYANSVEDIRRLEKVIDMLHAKNEIGSYEELMQRKGKKEGKFEIALKILKKRGIEEAIELTGFTKKELETGKLSKK